MPLQSEIIQRLSADNSNYRSVMNQSEAIADKTGKAILKNLDVRAGVVAIAAAIGLNINSIAEGLARLVTGMSKAEEKRLDDLVESTDKAAREQEKKLEAARARKERADEEHGQRMVKQADLVREQIIAAAEDQEKAIRNLRKQTYEIQQAADAAHIEQVKDNIEFLGLEAKAKQGLTKDEQARLDVLRAQSKEIARQQEIATLLSLDKRTPQEEALLQTLLKQSAAYQDSLGVVKAITEETKAQGEVILSNIAAWKDFKASISTTGRGDRELSDAELQRKINQIEQDIFSRQVASPGQPDFFIEPQRNNLRQARSELDFRRRIRNEASSFGEDYALNKNPGVTESRLKEILQGKDASTNGKIADELAKLNAQLNKGVPTVLFGTDT